MYEFTNDCLSIFDDEEMLLQTLKTMDEYVELEIRQMSNPNFHETMICDVAECKYEEWKHVQDEDWQDSGSEDTCSQDSFKEFLDYEKVEWQIRQLALFYFETQHVPPRFRFYDTEQAENQQVVWMVKPETTQKEDFQENLVEKIGKLQNTPQPKQKSKEWYEFRHQVMTASSLYRIFGESQNLYIYEKCRPYVEQTYGNSTNSPMHWGVKYEPVSIQLYEKRFSTKIQDFGCIRHETYPCIAASPDGINTDISNPRLYGRMIEVKNVVSRIITGVPSQPYWIQMQIQMETCDLFECDFIETGFREISESEFMMETRDCGVLLHFAAQESFTPFYEYMPLDIPKDSVASWIQDTCDKYTSIYILVKPIYWVLEVFSCVLVERNIPWFRAVLPHILSTWDLIVKEQISGEYAKRKQDKQRICVVKLDA